MLDIEHILTHNEVGTLRILERDGDFRSPEYVELFKEADIVVTNLPFSLFREYVAMLMKYNKKFIILGNKNVINYKEIFPLLQHGQIWLGVTMHSGRRKFTVPDYYDYDGVMGVPVTFMDKFSPKQFEIVCCTESEVKGLSNGLWHSDSGVAQPLINASEPISAY